MGTESRGYAADGGVATEDWGLRARVQTESMGAEDMLSSRGTALEGYSVRGA